MSATLSAGVNSLILKLDTPYDTIRTSDIRDDLVKVRVWCSATSGFTPSDSNKVFDALSLSIIIPKLADGTALVAGTTYYLRYAFISGIDETVFTISSELNAIPTQGTPGSSVTMIFKRSAVQPTTPGASASTPSGWYADVDSVPVGTDPIWTSVGSKAGSASLFTWQTPIRIEGEGGIRGDSFRIAYKTQSQSALIPIITPNTTTGNATFPAGWDGVIDTPAAGESLWASDGIYNTPSNTTTWGTPYLTQGFPVTIQSDNYNAVDTGWQIQRDTGNAFFNNVTARGSLITGSVGAQRIEINKATSNRIEAFRSDNIRFLTIGGSGGTTQDTAVIGISANSNVINPVWVESSSTVGSGILSNTLSTANAISSVSTGGGRLFYGSITNSSNPDAAIRLDISSIGHSGKGIAVNMGASTGAAFAAGGTGDGYAFDGVSGTSGTAGSKSGIAYFRGIDFPTESSAITNSGTQAQLVVAITNNLVTSGPVIFSITLESTLYQTILEYDTESGFVGLNHFVAAVSASISDDWVVSATGSGAGNLNNPTFTFKRAVVGVSSGTTSGTISTGGSTYTGSFTPGTAITYSSTPTIVRLTPFPNDVTKVLRGNGTWGTIAGTGGGTVSSVGLTVPTGFTVSNSPVTGIGTLAISFDANATARKVLYGNGTWAYIDKRYNVLDYGATGNGSTNDYTAIQSAITAATATGGTVYFPRGIYNIGTSLTYSAPAGADPNYRVHFAGDGVGASVIKQTSTGNGLTIAANSANPNLYTHIQDLGFVGSGSGQGLSISGGAYVYVEACHFTGWAYGFYGSNFLSSTFSACEFRFNERGFVIERISSTYSSSPNAITMLNCEIGANSLFGGWVLGPGVFTMQGGAIEGNGTTNGSSSNWAMRISEPSGVSAIESAVGISLDGVYFEANVGMADLWITSTTSKSGVTNNINGCSFVRVGTSYVTNNILLDSTSGNGFNNFISGCGFKGLGGYTPSSSRKTIANNNNKVDLVGCSFDSVTDAYVINNASVFENPVRVASITDLAGNSFGYTSTPAAAGTASAGSSALFAKGDHVHPFSVTTAAASGSGSISYSAGVLTYTPPVISASGVTSVSGTGSGLGFSLSGTVTSTGSLTLSTPTASALQTSLGLGSLAYVSSLTTFQELNSTALASNVPGAGDIRVLANAGGVRTWGTMSELRSSIGSGTPSSSTYLRGDGTWAAPFGSTITVSGIITGSEFTSSNSIGDEGGQINLAKAATNTTLVGGVTIDVYQNKLRIFEKDGTNRGVYIDLSAATASVGTNLVSGGSAGVTSVALTVPTGLSVSGSPVTTSGTIAITLTSGYSIPTTTSQTNWDTAYTDRNKWDGGSTGLIASTGRTSLGGTTVGQSFFTLTNPGAVTFPRINADNTVSSLTAAQLATAIGVPTYTSGTGISISSNTISLNTALAADTTLFTNNQIIGGVTIGTASSIGGFQAKNQLSAGFFTKTLNAVAGGLVGVYLTTTQDGNEVVTTSAFKHTSSSGARPDLGENTTGGRWGTIYAAAGNFSGAVATGTLTVTGSITASGDITAYSDQRLKTNTQVITDPFKAMDDVYGMTYDRIDTGEKGMGFIAQNFQKHYPDIVKETDDGTLSLKYLNIIAILWEQNRELNGRLKALEDKYDAADN